MLGGERDPLGAGCRLQRAEPTRTQDVAGELQILHVVVDDQHERRLHIGRPAGAWRRRRHRILSMPIRLVLAEDNYLVREGVRRLLETQPGLEVAAACGDLDSLLAAVDVERPDVVVTDIRMPPGDADEGIQAAERLHETNPEVGVVVLSQYANPTYALALLQERATRLPPEGAREGRRSARRRDPRRGRRRLGDRSEGRRGVGRAERSRRGVAAERVDAASATCCARWPRKNNAAIAEALFLTEKSVEKVIHSIFLKLGLTWESAVHKRVKAVILYLAEST